MCRQNHGFGIDEDLCKLPPVLLTQAANLPPVIKTIAARQLCVGVTMINVNFRKDVSSLTPT
jgi:hypothetical protein